jgi:hypothetical protein
LTIGKAGGLCTFEGLTDKGENTLLVDFLVGSVKFKGIVEGEMMLFNEFCKVYFCSIEKRKGKGWGLRERNGST